MDLGAAMRKSAPDYGPIIEMMSGMKDAITADIRQSVLDEMASMLAKAVAQISVAAPNVTVTPTIQVDVPGEDDAGEIAAADRQTVVLEKISTQLAALYALMAKPVTKTVERYDGEIIKVTETR